MIRVGNCLVGLLVLAILGACAIFIYLKLLPPSGPVEKAVVPGSGPSKPVGSPEPDFLIRHAPELGLSPEQVRKLHKQEAEFEKTTSPLRKGLDAAGKAVANELNRLTNQKVKMPDMEERTRIVKELSAKMAELRAAAWKEEQKILTPEQRQKALDAWAKVHRMLPTGQPAGKPETPEKSKGNAPGAAPGGGG